MNPAFVYFGSKHRLAGRIAALLPPRRVWCELFAGTAVVTLAKPRHASEHVNDLNGDIVNFFRVLRDPVQRHRLIEAVALTPYAQAELREAMAVRDWPTCTATAALSGDPVEQARLFLVRGRMMRGGDRAHLGGFRWSKKQNSDPARYWGGVMPGLLADIAERLTGVTIWQEPAQRLLARMDDPDVVVYADPPYPAHTLRSYDRYVVTMTDDEHLAFARQLARSRCAIVLSMAQGSVYSEVLRDWHVAPVTVTDMAANATTELLLTNFRPATLFSQEERAAGVAGKGAAA